MSLFPEPRTRNENPGASPRSAPEPDPVRLGPEADFPEDLTLVSLVELQVLDSRLRCQLDDEVMSVSGVHPQTVDRHGEVARELEVRRERHIGG